MSNFKFRFFIVFAFTFIVYTIKSQTLIMNEVSNGPTGSQEYVEFVVVSNTITYSCSSPTPPCIDIRGWIFDDNSGYHGTSGIAAGAVRFSQDPLWACVPLGTIILIYNDADKNPEIPTTDDLSMADGNCSIIAPISNVSLFEKNLTTPGAAACSYPSSGWTAGGDWAFTALANGSDCARIVNLAGCEVFSVCYGATDNLNTLIYFPASGTGTVYSFNSIDPQLQANWTSGSASTMQTPGVPNNPANAAYIAQFNNGCLPITQPSVTAVGINAGCTCNGSATANASGSIGGYTYVWYDASMNPIGQTAATANGLCAGIYNVIATSHIGCTATTSVTITSSSTTSVTVNSQTVCAGISAILTATPSTAGGTFSWIPGGQTTSSISVSPGSTTTYSVIYTLTGCSGTNTGIVTIQPLPTITVNSPTICAGQTATLTANGATTYVWNTGSSINPLTASPTSNINFTVTGTVNGCTNIAVANILVTPLPIVTVNSSTICSGLTATLIANGASTYTWSNGSTNSALLDNPITTTNYTVLGEQLGCVNSATANIIINSNLALTVNSPTICVGQTAILIASGASTYTWNNGAITNSINVSPINTSTYSIIGSSAACSGSVISTVVVNALPSVSVNSSTICSGQTITLTASGATTYIWNTGAVSNSLIATPTANTNYTVIGTANSCSNSAVSNVFVNPSPTLSVNSPSMCVGQSITLTASGATTYSWNTGVLTNTLVVSPNATTHYTVIGTTNSCTNSAVSNIIVKASPNVLVSPLSICSGQTATLIATGATNYVWGDGSTSSQLIVSPSATSTYSVSGFNGSCLGIGVGSVTVNDAPTISFNSNISSGCAPLCVTFSNLTTVTSGSISSWNWSFGNGDISSLQSPSYCFTNSGLYNVGLTAVSSNGCTKTTVINNMIDVFDSPVASFTTNVQETDILDPNIQFTNQSVNSVTYEWSFGDENQSTQINPFHTYNLEGVYEATLVATSQNGCTDTTANQIKINGVFTFYAPNTFTPNGDNINEMFMPIGIGWDESHYKFYIYDRWGNECFSTGDPNIGWNGRANNGSEAAQIDTYTWKAELKDIFGKTHKYIGKVMILR